MGLLTRIKEKAKKHSKRIVLPEGDDQRIVKAKDYISKSKIAEIVLIKKGERIKGFDRLVDQFRLIRHEHKKDMTKEEIEKIFLENNVYVAAMMVKLGLADGFVAGASHRTSDVARAALHCIDVDKTLKVMSGGFVIEVPGSKYGHNGSFVFSDCGIVPFPTKEQLIGITVSAAKFADKILNVEPRVAILSYSTKGSATSPNLDVIREAVESVRRSYPRLKIDGELQVDAALDPHAADIKSSVSGSSVAGKANVLIFPNLDSGNIAYKLIQRLTKARAVGPVLLGLEKPCSDLSRACSIDDIIDAVAITSVMAQ